MYGKGPLIISSAEALSKDINHMNKLFPSIPSTN